MTNKRFVHIEHKGADYILDSPNWDLDFIELLGDSLEPKELVGLLNNLHEENEQLKCINDQLEELLELSENIKKRYREKLIDMNLKMVFDDEC